MYYLRAVRNRSPFTPAGFDLNKAVAQLADRDGRPASVFAVSDEADADRVAVLFAMLIKPGPEQLDYVLIPAAWLAEVGVSAQAEPADIVHPVLRHAHHELHGLDAPGVCEQLAARFNDPSAIVKRLSQKIVTTMAKAELASDADGHAHALIAGKPRWNERVGEVG